METIDLEKARELLLAAVETQGRDFVYSDGGACWYVPVHSSLGFTSDDVRTKTGCIVGTALKLAGFEGLRQEDIFPVIAEGHPNGCLIIHYPDLLTSPAAEYLQVAQEEQDGSSTWGEAYDAAEESIS